MKITLIKPQLCVACEQYVNGVSNDCSGYDSGGTEVDCAQFLVGQFKIATQRIDKFDVTWSLALHLK